jgi:D-serine deaminase-like pyridoxal phosphate-dependent protein
VGAVKTRRVLNVPTSARLTVAVDSAESIESLAEAADAAHREVGIYVEVDLGMHRVGVPSIDEAVALARHVKQLPPLEFDGVTFYPGHIREPVDEQGEKLEQLRRDVAALRAALEDIGMPARVVSGGSTPAAWHMHEVEGVTEVRPGTYVYNDRTTAMLGACSWDDCAFTVLATVVSTAVPNQAVVDAGTKALGREPLGQRGSRVRGNDSGGEGFGALLDNPDVIVARMSEEHGILDLSRTSWRPHVGDVVRIVPNHVCVVVHLNDAIHGVRGELVETTWPVTARGREAAAAGRS